MKNRGARSVTMAAGDRFGRFVAVAAVADPVWLFDCDCGTRSQRRKYPVVSGRILSCGCLRNEKTVERQTTHGRRNTSEYNVWRSMRDRCFNPNSEYSAEYAGRGIIVCQRWNESFSDFFADMGARPSPSHTIDRIDNDGNYEPGNCRWATKREQANNRRSNRRLTFMGVTCGVSEWADRQGLGRSTVEWRIKRGWSVERALTTPSAREKKAA